MYCNQCGARANSGAQFCQNCGTELEKETVSETDRHPDRPTKGEPDARTEYVNPDLSSEASEIPEDHSKTFLGGIYHPWRRFFARTVDLFSLGLLLLLLFSFIGGHLFPQDVVGFVKAIENPIMAGVILYLLWLPVEAAFLAASGTTPAKWIFGISVLSTNGAKLSYSNALKRAFLVWIQGEGLGIPLVTLFTRLFAYRRLTKTGTTLWDTSVNSVVAHKKWGVIRAILSVLIVLVVMLIVGILNSIGNA